MGYFVGDYVYVNSVNRYGYIVEAWDDNYLIEFNDGKTLQVKEDDFVWMGDN